MNVTLQMLTELRNILGEDHWKDERGRMASISVGAGWHEILREMFNEMVPILKATPIVALEDKFQIHQIKEKFGYLTIYHSSSDPRIIEIIKSVDDLKWMKLSRDSCNLYDALDNFVSLVHNEYKVSNRRVMLRVFNENVMPLWTEVKQIVDEFRDNFTQETFDKIERIAELKKLCDDVNG